ncbi:MAG TPA: nitroreductase/quinone reductase family protein [Candidatus Limnocylindrales bacterium]
MTAPTTFDDLPYGPRFARALPFLHRAFLIVNRRFAAPMLRAGLGSLLSTPVTGSMMLLRTRGRRSGAVREAPLGYVIWHGAIYCVAGFGGTTHWFRNLLADPHVECVLPAVAVSGVAEAVTDPAEWAAAYEALIRSMGVIGRLTVGDVRELAPEALDQQRQAFPLVRIRPDGIAPGAFDPGGLGWLPAIAMEAWLTVGAARLGFRCLRAIGRRVD